MPAIPTRIHPLLDLAVAVLLLSAPWWGGFAGANAEMVSPGYDRGGTRAGGD